MSKLVYLAGPITGLTHGGATNWREYARKSLNRYGITGLSPMRYKDYLQDELVIADSYAEHTLSTTKAITSRDRWDVMRCDVVLMNVLGAKQVSIGTMIEAGWADVFRKPVVLIMEDGVKSNLHDHGMLKEIAGWTVSTLDSGIEVVGALLG